jgi:hypothetical protein
MNAALSRWLIRRIRFAGNDPLVEVCRQHGYHVEPEIRMDGSHNYDTMVIDFPMDYGPKAVTESEVDVIKELETQKMLQTFWSDQSVSCSHYFHRDEVPLIRTWLNDHYSESVKTCAFMHVLDHGFKQTPLETITEDEYHKMLEKVTPITQITDNEEIDMVDNLECAGGSCPAK